MYMSPCRVGSTFNFGGVSWCSIQGCTATTRIVNPFAQCRLHPTLCVSFVAAGAVAWDTVEELSAAAAHKKVAEGKPMDVLDKFCEVGAPADFATAALCSA